MTNITTPPSTRRLLGFALALIAVGAFIPASASAGTPAPSVVVKPISTGKSNTCFLLSDGSVSCWGTNTAGESTPPYGTGYTSVASGDYGSCAIKAADGQLNCWGDDYWLAGQPRSSQTKAVDVASGKYHTCAVKTDGTLACWGLNVGRYWAPGANQAVPPSGSFTRVSAGAFHSCALRYDSTITCWGDNWTGQASSPSGSFARLASGRTHNCAVGTDGSITCWGENGDGRATAPSGSNWADVTAGYSHSCALATDGSVSCWGSNAQGQRTVPAGTYRAISAGGNHTCALTTSNAVRCWGSNASGQTTLPTGPRIVSASQRGSWDISLRVRPGLSPLSKVQLYGSARKPLDSRAKTGLLNWGSFIQVTGSRRYWVRVGDAAGKWTGWVFIPIK